MYIDIKYLNIEINGKAMDRVTSATAQWRHERPELDLLPMEVTARLGTTARLISRNFLDPFFRKYGLQQGEFDVLATLRRSGVPYSLGPTQLFEALMISSGGMTNRIDRLEKAGLIVRSPNPEDRRGMLVSLTEKGLKLIDDLVPLHIDNEARALAGLDREEQQTLNALLGKLLVRMEEE